MANVLGQLASALIVQRALALTFQRRPILNRFSLNLTGEEVLFNQEVRSRIKTVPAVSDFSQNATDVQMVDVPVTIDRFKQVYVQFTPQQISATDRNLIDEQAEPMAVSISNYLVDDVASLFSDATFGSANKTVCTVGNTAYSTLVSLRKKLITRGVPEGFKKFAMVNSDVYEKLLNDPLCNRSLKTSETMGDPITTGELVGVAGFEAISEFPGLPTTDNMVGAFGTPDAVVLAARIPKDPRSVLPGVNAPFNLGTVTIPADKPGAGFTVMVQEWIGTDLTANVRLCWMYGRAKGNVNNLERQVTA